MDVETCINAIEELLIDKYAELSKDLTTVKKMNDAVHYVDGAFGLRYSIIFQCVDYNES